MHHPHKTSVVFKVGLLFGLVLPLSSHAQISDDTLVRRMIQEGRFDDALSNLDASIKRSPRDAQLHLLRGAALSMSNRKAEALKAFAYMVDQQLDTATAYNNIAVILASRGLYEGARGALECALKANPNYVTARQNMGDVYANLSNLAYRQALHMDRSDPSLPTKLAHLTQMLGDSANQTQQPDTPQDGRYYAQPCTPEPLQVARQSFDAVPMTSINPTPVVPAQSPLIPEPQPASPPSQYKSSSDVPAGLPSFGNGVSRPSQPPAATPLPGQVTPSDGIAREIGHAWCGAARPNGGPSPRPRTDMVSTLAAAQSCCGTCTFDGSSSLCHRNYHCCSPSARGKIGTFDIF
jgi:Tetratricopeptide repeat